MWHMLAGKGNRAAAKRCSSPQQSRGSLLRRATEGEKSPEGLQDENIFAAIQIKELEGLGLD